MNHTMYCVISNNVHLLCVNKQKMLGLCKIAAITFRVKHMELFYRVSKCNLS